MPALDCWGGLKISIGWMRGRGGWRRREVEAVPAVVRGLTSEEVSGGWHGVARWWSGTERAAWWALKMTPSNKRMHATRDTTDVIERNLAGGRVMRSVRSPERGGPIRGRFAPPRGGGLTVACTRPRTRRLSYFSTGSRGG
jgi:hypothetical protein